MADLRNIDFDELKVTSESFDLDIDFDEELRLESPRATAYVLGWQLSKRRSGSAHTKSMSEISGTTAKPHNQKGTGHARQGSKRSVQFRGGRTCFGPRFRSFEYSLPKKIVKIALADVIRLKFRENKIILFSGLSSELKTSKVAKLLQSNNISNALFLYQDNDASNVSLTRSIKNIKNINSLNFKGLNVYDILNSDFLILDKNLFQTIKEVAL
ncbi:MAG: large subunit ribosomal protein L4 [Rickettsiales bacterium]|jgi:large subunit ribosomal protein L4